MLGKLNTWAGQGCKAKHAAGEIVAGGAAGAHLSLAAGRVGEVNQLVERGRKGSASRAHGSRGSQALQEHVAVVVRRAALEHRDFGCEGGIEQRC